MDGMADFSSAVSILPWVWVIEYLARFKEVETSILHDLIELAPEIPDDLAKAVREMVALRCLEDLFGSSDKFNDDGVSDTENKIEFDLSESCEVVLQQIVQETPASDLEMAGPELLKWDVHPFIMHKRASMPKCALQQLKDTILEGTHPLAASLKESSGLVCVNEGGTCVGDLDHNDEFMSEKETLLPSTYENENRLSGDDLHNGNVLPLKRGRDDLAARDMAGHSVEIQEEIDLNNNAKKLKQVAISNHQAADKNSVLVCGKETVEILPGRVVAMSRGEGSNTAKQSQDEGVEESQLPEDGCDNCADLRMLRQNGAVSDDQIQHNVAVNGHTTDNKMPPEETARNAIMDEANVAELRTSTGVYLVGAQRKDTVDVSRGERECSCGEEISSDNDEYQNERIDVSVEKSHFLSSKTSLDHDSLATSGWTEQNLCVKCNKDGQLLTCSTSTCPLLVHENCLGFPVKFDENGNFHCPFCAYTLAISKYLEAKKNTSMARKELAAFIQMGLEHPEKGLADRLHRKDLGHLRSNGDKDIHENWLVEKRENNQEIQNGQHVHAIKDHLCQKGRAGKKNLEPSASCVNASSPCREEEANTFSGRGCVSNGEKVREESMVNECSSERGLEGQLEHTPSDPKSDCDKLTRTNTYVAPVDCTEAEGEIQKEDLQHASSDRPEKPVIALNLDGSEGENDKFIISKYWIRFRRQESHCTYPAIPQLRRKKVPWTAKEEETLKKGVRKFASVDDRTIPWKKILEFGSSVFLTGRTTIDLKDKWRNMCRGSPSAK